jgi:DNA-binding transcriptional ArsR family regulator
MNTVELVLHPLRLRIIQAFLGGRQLTTTQLSAELSEIPPASLYRHIALLSEGGILDAVSQRQVRGTVERTYALRLDGTQATAKELARMSRDEHLQAFTTFAASLISTYERYLATGKANLVRDRVSYAMNAFWLTDAEYEDFLRDLSAVIQPRAHLGPKPGRKRRLGATMLMPLPGTDGG